jgi:hypothetical protein
MTHGTAPIVLVPTQGAAEIAPTVLQGSLLLGFFKLVCDDPRNLLQPCL